MLDVYLPGHEFMQLVEWKVGTRNSPKQYLGPRIKIWENLQTPLPPTTSPIHTHNIILVSTNLSNLVYKGSKIISLELSPFFTPGLSSFVHILRSYATTVLSLINIGSSYIHNKAFFAGGEGGYYYDHCN